MGLQLAREVALRWSSSLRKGARVAANYPKYARRRGDAQAIARGLSLVENAAAAELDEGRRFPICNPDSLTALLAGAGLRNVSVTSLEIPTPFRDFGDFWTPFLRGTGPAPAYVASLSEAQRSALRERLASRLKAEIAGGIRLRARAWGVRGVSG